MTNGLQKNSRTAICTIVAKNYLAGARVLSRSFLGSHTGSKVYVLFIDPIDSCFDPAQESFETVLLADIDFPSDPSYRFKYNLTELATAVKPFFLRHLFAKTDAEMILYLDPDIMVTGSLDPLFDRLETSPIILTPHLDADFPEDGLEPDECHILRSGVFNLGFLGARRSSEADELLVWLENKLLDRCVIEHEKGYFVDQRFFDLAYAIFPFIHVERDPGYNVAYWNLHSRTLSRDGGQWLCNKVPLRFFHFSSYPVGYEFVSRHCNRFRLSERPDLSPLFKDYENQLLEAGALECRKWPYPYNCFSNGYPIHDRARKIYRSTECWLERFGNPFESIVIRVFLVISCTISRGYAWFFYRLCEWLQQGSNRAQKHRLGNCAATVPRIDRK